MTTNKDLMKSAMDTRENQLLFEMPGIKPALDILDSQLFSSFFKLDHVLIRGPRGSGKRFFIQKVKNRLDHYFEIIEDNCEIISVEQLRGWVQYDRNEKRIIFLDKLEKLRSEDYKYLNELMVNVRVIAVLMDDEFQPPPEILEKFQIFVDVPPLFKHRADLLYFIAMKWPRHRISHWALFRLCAYHWPGNFRELDRAVQRYFTAGELSQEITGGNKFRNIFNSILESGIDISKLRIAINTCFAYVVPLVGKRSFFEDLEFEVLSNDDIVGIQFIVERDSSEIALNDLEVQFIIKSFFQLVFGESVMSYDGNLFELEPFGLESLKVIEWAQQEVEGWVVGCNRLRLGTGIKNFTGSRVPYFNNSLFRLPRFSEELTQQQIDAVTNFLSACKNVCEQNIAKLKETIPGNVHGKNINTETGNEATRVHTHEQPTLPQQENLIGSSEVQGNDIVVTNESITSAFGWSMNTIKTWSEKAGVQIMKNESGKNMMTHTDIVKVKAFHKKYARE